MTVRRHRALLAAGAACLGPLAVIACEKPSPNAHFTLGTHTSSPEAADDCYGHGEPLGQRRAAACVAGGGDTPAFTVRSGDTFHIGVDPEIADTGWLLFVDGELWGGEPFTTTYRSFGSPDLYAVAQRSAAAGELPVTGGLHLIVTQVSEDYDVDEVYNSQTLDEFQRKIYASVEGVWHARLEPEQT